MTLILKILTNMKIVFYPDNSLTEIFFAYLSSSNVLSLTSQTRNVPIIREKLELKELEKEKRKSFNLHWQPFFISFEFRRYGDFCSDCATMATIFSLFPCWFLPSLPGEKLQCKQRILPVLPTQEKTGKRTKKVDTRISDAPVG